jgi:hypothetical protein
MRTSIKAALVAFTVLGALATGASAQPYGYGPGPGYGPPPGPGYAPGYDDSYYGAPDGDGYYGDDSQYADAYGPACDPYYGCPDDYYDQPYFDGALFYDGAWLNGPFFYRDYGGRRQYWVHGGWHFAEGRGGHYRAALGRAWYQNHESGRGVAGGTRNYGNYRDYSQRAGNSSYQPQRSFGGGDDWRSRTSNARGFGANSYQQQAQQNWQRGWQQRGGGRPQPAAPQAQPQVRSGGHGDHDGRGDGGWRR